MLLAEVWTGHWDIKSIFTLYMVELLNFMHTYDENMRQMSKDIKATPTSLKFLYACIAWVLPSAQVTVVIAG